MNKKVGTKAYVCAFCIAAASNFGFSVIYAYTSYYVAFQTATGFTNTQLGLLLTVLGIASTILYLPGRISGGQVQPDQAHDHWTHRCRCNRLYYSPVPELPDYVGALLYLAGICNTHCVESAD